MEQALAGGATAIAVLLVALVVLVVVSLVCRELVAWYFKINEALTVLKSIDSRLTALQNEAIRSAAERANAERAQQQRTGT